MTRIPKIILALDVDNLTRAKQFVNKLYPRIKIFKVGLQLFTLCGPEIIKFIQKKGAEVFLDLKFFDIPNTVSNAVIQAARLKIKMLTIHITGGREMITAAVNASKQEAERLKIKPPLLIGVTVLTSKDAESDEVLSLAQQGLSCGLDGVVCSVREAAYLREKIKKDFYIVTPGIRPAVESRKDDQKRTGTPGQAIAAGSDFLVIGRPILEAGDSVLAAEEISKVAANFSLRNKTPR